VEPGCLPQAGTWGVPKDAVRTAQLYKAAADPGDPCACRYCGGDMRFGDGVRRDFVEARLYLLKGPRKRTATTISGGSTAAEKEPRSAMKRRTNDSDWPRTQRRRRRQWTSDDLPGGEGRPSRPDGGRAWYKKAQIEGFALIYRLPTVRDVLTRVPRQLWPLPVPDRCPNQFCGAWVSSVDMEIHLRRFHSEYDQEPHFLTELHDHMDG
jgi:TPR repeat protein